MATQIPQPGESESELSETTGASSNASLEGTLQQRRHLVVHRKASNVATKNMTQHTHFNIVCDSRISTNKMQHAIGCVYVHMMGDSRQLITK